MVAHPAVHVIGLCGFPQRSTIPAVDHTPVHGDGVAEDIFKEAGALCLLDGVDAALRKSKVDRFGKVQRDRLGIAEIYGCARKVIGFAPEVFATDMRQLRCERDRNTRNCFLVVVSQIKCIFSNGYRDLASQEAFNKLKGFLSWLHA